jgi:hypothetical protein
MEGSGRRNRGGEGRWRWGVWIWEKGGRMEGSVLVGIRRRCVKG